MHFFVLRVVGQQQSDASGGTVGIAPAGCARRRKQTQRVRRTRSRRSTYEEKSFECVFTILSVVGVVGVRRATRVQVSKGGDDPSSAQTHETIASVVGSTHYSATAQATAHATKRVQDPQLRDQQPSSRVHVAARLGHGSTRHERLDARDGPPEDERVDVCGALVRVDRLEVARVPDDLVQVAVRVLLRCLHRNGTRTLLRPSRGTRPRCRCRRACRGPRARSRAPSRTSCA